MSGRNVNIYFQEENYNQIKELIAERRISKFVNRAVERELEQEKKAKREKLILAYKRVAKNESKRAEAKI